jgi:hypothetical protein
MCVLQTEIHICAVICEASLVFCFHTFTVEAATQNGEDSKFVLV